jgi:hypothetical protein
VVNTILLLLVVIATSDAYGGTMNLSMGIDAWAEDPAYDMNAGLKNAKLEKLNGLFKVYADFDVNNGNLNMNLEIFPEKDGMNG